MLGEGVQEVQKKVFSVWCCYLMIAAMFFWGGSFVSGEEPEIIDLDGPDGDIFKNDFASLLSDPYGSEEFGDFKLTFNGDGIFTFDRGILGGRSIHTDTLDQLRDDESFDLVNSDTWKDGVLTLENEGGVKMAIFLGNGEESAPDNIQSVEINKHTSIDYTVITDDGEANIHVSNLRGLYHLKDGDGDEILIEGLPKEAKIVDISEGGRVTIGSWGDGIDYRGPETTVEYDGIELRQAIYEPDDSIQSYHNSGSLSLDNFGNPRITNLSLIHI